MTTPDDAARDALPAGHPDRQNSFPRDARLLTSYDGNCVRVTDQAGKVRDSCTDALGRLDLVEEDPNGPQNPAGLDYGTTYKYDPLDNLREVTQGTQRRYFMYDSLGRLIRTRSPEQGVEDTLAIADPVTGNSVWSTAFEYDADSNLTRRTDTRGATATYGYDALNRNITITYAGGAGVDPTPAVSRHYDNQPNARGSLWKTSGGGGYTELLERDAFGRPQRHRQWFLSGGVWRYFDTTYAYDLAGNMTGQGYPSGHTTSHQYDAAGRPQTFTGNLGDGSARTYVAGTLYDSAGRVRQEQYGTATPVYNKSFYNPRGQLAEVRVSTQSVTTPGQEGNWNRGAILNVYSGLAGWTESREDNNGNLRKQMLYVPNDDAVSGWWETAFFYDYDALNRLRQAREVTGGQNQWVQYFDYDRWGNRTINAGNTFGVNEKQFTVDQNTNQLGVPAGQGGAMVYDKAGNLTTDTYSGYGTRLYDAENRITRETTAGIVTARYTYDGDERRTRRAANGQEWWYVYGLDGELLAEYGAGFPAVAQQEYGYQAGRLLVTASGYGEQGLQADYYNGVNFNTPALTRTDPNVNFEWHAASPGAGVNAEEFTARWTGFVTPRYTETYTFYTQSDDGARLWVNGQLIVDKWIDQGWTEWSGQITLQAGRKYEIRMEFYERWHGAIAKLLWSSASQAKEVVPASQLTPPEGGSAVKWLIGDQLGTPRMVLDRTGALSKVTRHDYLPFGEELFTGAGGRGPNQGYSASEGVRQQFTGYERDNETGLDYAQARYYSSAQGRFTSPDNFLNDTSAVDPASWNLYAYVRNNPLRYTDPSGEKIYVGGLSQDDRDELLKRANYTYGCQSCVSVDKNGYLAVDTSGLSKDVLKATQFLTDAINTTSWYGEVRVSNNDSNVAFGEGRAARGSAPFEDGSGRRRNADLIVLDFGDDQWVSGDSRARDAFLNTVFAHEVAHFRLKPGTITRDPDDIGKTGPVVDAVNEILQARGLSLRARYYSSARGGHWLEIYHGIAERDRAGNIMRNQGGGIRVKINETGNVIRWLKRNVGGKGIN